MVRYIYLILFLVAVSFVSCVEDEGKYNLVPVNEVSIEGLNKDGYPVLANVDVLHIEADVVGTIAGKNADELYDFTWFVKKIDTESSEINNKQVIGTERILDYKVALAPGTYRLYLEVLDKKTELKWLKETTIEVTTSTTTGFLVLGDKEDGTIKLDMIAMRANRDTVVVEDVLMGEKQMKNATSLVFAGRPSYGGHQTLWLTTETTSYALTNGSYFKIMEDITPESMMYTTFNVKRPMRIMDMFPRQAVGYGSRNNSNRGYITEDAIYTVSMMSDPQRFGNPINRYSNLSEELFQPYYRAFFKGGGYMSAFSLNCIYYDMTNNCFVAPNSSSASSITHCVSLGNKDKEGDAFVWDQKGTTRKLVYGQNGYAQLGYSYALMKDDNNNWFIYRFIVSSSTAPGKDGGWAIDLSLAKNFDKASHYAFSSDETEILYTVGSELCGADYERKITALLKDYGKEIILLEPDGQSTTSTKDFIVVLADGDYKSIVCKIQMVNNPDAVEMIESDRMIWNINSKVKAIEWKDAPDQEKEEDYF